MKDKKGANIQHAMMGLIVTMVSDLNMTVEDVKKSITFEEESAVTWQGIIRMAVRNVMLFVLR